MHTTVFYCCCKFFRKPCGENYPRNLNYDRHHYLIVFIQILSASDLSISGNNLYIKNSCYRSLMNCQIWTECLAFSSVNEVFIPQVDRGIASSPDLDGISGKVGIYPSYFINA